jgi:hypothetical protein
VCSASVCKRKLFEDFYAVLADIPVPILPLTLRFGNERGCSYYEAKCGSVTYWQARKEFLAFFPNWYTSDGTHYEQFRQRRIAHLSNNED